MKKNLAKKITLSILAGAVLMSSSIAWAAVGVYEASGEGSFYVGFQEDNGGLGGSKNSVAIGSKVTVNGNNNVALGANADVSAGSANVVIGSNASTGSDCSNAVAIGSGAKVTGNKGIALGQGSIASGNVVSVGDAGSGIYRKIVNVADGEADHDAATVGQMVGYVNSAVAGKANATDVANTYATITKLNEKANAADVYMRNELDTKLDNYAKTDDVANTYATITKLNEKANAVDVYTKTETDNVITSAVSGKADKATTLAGYGITDAYTKNEVDTELGKKADKATTLSGYGITDAYTKNEVDTELGKKADKATTLSGYGITDAYTKEQVNDLINGGSAAIAGLNQRLEKTNAKINKVGAGAAALAALHPLDYDPDDKLTFSAGMGNYAGENAAALGAFYRPNEKFMLSLGGTMGNGENMVNLGLSIGLDKASGFAKLSKRELIQKVNVMEAKYEAVEAENEAMKAEIIEMKAMLQELLAKK